MNITPINYNRNINSNPSFSGQIVPNKYLENCIQYTLKTNDNSITKNLITSLSALLNDGTERSFEFDAIVKNSTKGLKYAPTVTINKIKQPLKLQAMYDISELNKKTLAEECLNSIDALINKCAILTNKKNEQPNEFNSITFIKIEQNKNHQPNKLKDELEHIYKLIFEKKNTEVK